MPCHLHRCPLYICFAYNSTLCGACAGRFGFVEMRTEELATSAMALDKVELCGRNINVGRPKGYVEPPQVVTAASLLPFQTLLGMLKRHSTVRRGASVESCFASLMSVTRLM